MPFLYDETYNSELECAVCLSPFEMPVELIPCGHVFCRPCIEGLDTCPECRQHVSAREAPNRLIVNLLSQLPGKCSECDWEGSREQFEYTHRTNCTGKRRPPLISPPAVKPATANGTGANENDPFNLFPAVAPDNIQPMQRQRSSQASLDPFSGIGGAPWEEYGLSQVEYDEIAVAMEQQAVQGEHVEHADIHSIGVTLDPAIRVATWLNAPNNARDVSALFTMFNMDPMKDRINLHQFCVWFSSVRRDPTKVYGITEHQYVSVLGMFHAMHPNFRGSLLLNEKHANEIANLVLERTVPASEVRDYMGPRENVSLHELLLMLESAHDGWELCGVPTENSGKTTAVATATASSTTARAAAGQQKKGLRASISDFFSRRKRAATTMGTSAPPSATTRQAQPSQPVPSQALSQQNTRARATTMMSPQQTVQSVPVLQQQYHSPNPRQPSYPPQPLQQPTAAYPPVQRTQSGAYYYSPSPGNYPPPQQRQAAPGYPAYGAPQPAGAPYYPPQPAVSAQQRPHPTQPAYPPQSLQYRQSAVYHGSRMV